MAGIKKRGIISTQRKRYWNGLEVKPVKYYKENTSGRMVGAVNDEIIRDKTGNPIPYSQI